MSFKEGFQKQAVDWEGLAANAGKIGKKAVKATSAWTRKNPLKAVGAGAAAGAGLGAAATSSGDKDNQ